MHPILLDRMEDVYSNTMNSLVSIKNVNFVLINSMGMEGDNCDLCQKTEREVQKLANQLSCYRGEGYNCNINLNKTYSRPVLLQVYKFQKTWKPNIKFKYLFAAFSNIQSF